MLQFDQLHAQGAVPVRYAVGAIAHASVSPWHLRSGYRHTLATVIHDTLGRRVSPTLLRARQCLPRCRRMTNSPPRVQTLGGLLVSQSQKVREFERLRSTYRMALGRGLDGGPAARGPRSARGGAATDSATAGCDAQGRADDFGALGGAGLFSHSPPASAAHVERGSAKPCSAAVGRGHALA